MHIARNKVNYIILYCNDGALLMITTTYFQVLNFKNSTLNVYLKDLWT